MTTFTVTATQAGSTSAGIGMEVRVITGQSGTQPGTLASATQTTPSLSITPAASGSLVYGSLLGLSGAYTINGNSANEQDAHNIGGLEMCSFVSSSTTTSGTPVTLGYTATANGISICLCEIENSAGLAEDASSPAGVSAVALTVSTASFSPPAGSLLVAMVQSNGGGSVTSMGISDTSGLGLTWTEQVKQNGAGNGYSGIWTTTIPAGPPVQEISAAAVAASAAMRGATAAMYDAVIAPAAPASGNAVINANRDAIVVVTGGSVSGVSV